MAKGTSPLRFNWRNHPRPLLRHDEQSSAGAGEEIAEESLHQLWQGMKFDPTMSFCNFARAYSPTVKRWAEADPVGYVDGLNVYNAPVDEPISPVDPLGT